MPPLLSKLLLLLTGYLLGSIPSGWLAGRWLAGIDLRHEGSGSTGATNVLRLVGRGPALVVLIVDVLKGSLAVVLARTVLSGGAAAAAAAGWQLDAWVVAAGLAALAGHIWPVWLGGRGGKAVATGFGMLLGLAWPVGLACLGVFLAVLGLSRIVSLSSVVAALALPLLMALWSRSEPRPAYLALAVITAAMVVWRHRGNLQRLVEGREPRLGGGRG
jgi:glycerol-3-phosphate acyltransferase PlsY